MAKTAEGDVKNSVKIVLNKHKAWHYWPVVTGYGQRTLDCIGCHKGRAFAIETKRADLVMTPKQTEHMEKMTASGMRVFLINSKTGTTELEEWLREN